MSARADQAPRHQDAQGEGNSRIVSTRIRTMARGRPRHPDVLTPAVWRVANAVRHGMTNAAISRRLHISLWMAFFEDVDGQILALMAQVGFAIRCTDPRRNCSRTM